MKNKISYFFIPLLFFVVSSLFLALALYYGWLGKARSGIMLFCEEARVGMIKQPANSFSNLAFSIAGIYMAWSIYKDNFSNKNLFSRYKWYPLLMAIILVLLGAGSFAMHASNTFWGGFFDLLAMFLASSFFFSYALKRSLNISNLLFLVVFFSCVLFCSWVWMQPWNHFGFILSVGEIIFASQLLIAIGIELFMYNKSYFKTDLKWGVGSIAVFILAFAIWNLSRTQESLWCNPNSLVQGHAFWHILNALSFYGIFKYYVSEHKP